MSDNIKQQKKVLKEAKSYLATISTEIESLFESLKDSPAGDLKYVATKLKEIQDFIKSDNRTRTITESVNVNADMRNKVNNMIVKYQSAAINEDLVRKFFDDCYNVLDLAYHPDEPFEEYGNSGGVPCFSQPEAKALNDIVEKMFTWCDKQGIDIYGIGMQDHPAVQAGMGADIDLDETFDPEVGEDRYEGEQSLLADTSVENSPDYQRAYEEFMQWEQNDDELTKQAAHDFAMGYVKDSNEDFGALNEYDIEGPGPDVENEPDPEKLVYDTVGFEPQDNVDSVGSKLAMALNKSGFPVTFVKGTTEGFYENYKINGRTQTTSGNLVLEFQEPIPEAATELIYNPSIDKSLEKIFIGKNISNVTEFKVEDIVDNKIYIGVSAVSNNEH